MACAHQSTQSSVSYFKLPTTDTAPQFSILNSSFSIPRFPEHVVDHLLHPLVVRAAPVDLAAVLALVESVEELARLGLQQVVDRGLRHLLHRPVAADAALEGADRAVQCEAAHDLGQFGGPVRSRARSSRGSRCCA